jgi:Family of unknown function (DUF5946)
VGKTVDANVRILFCDLIGREFADPRLFRAHCLTVDAYCLQHPERDMLSTKSAATHLAGICWSLEIGESLHLPAALKRLVDGPRSFARVATPLRPLRGNVNIGNLAAVSQPDEYLAAAREWARSAWSAWSHGWPQTRAWVADARKSTWQ